MLFKNYIGIGIFNSNRDFNLTSHMLRSYNLSSSSSLKIGRRKVPGSISGRACQPRNFQCFSW